MMWRSTAPDRRIDETADIDEIGVVAKSNTMVSTSRVGRT